MLWELCRGSVGQTAWLQKERDDHSPQRHMEHRVWFPG